MGVVVILQSPSHCAMRLRSNGQLGTNASGLVPINDRYLSGLPEAEMRDAQVSVVGAVSIGSFELSR